MAPMHRLTTVTVGVVALVVVLLLAPQLSAATTTMLPFSGDVLVNVESVCRRVDSTTQAPSGNTTVRAFRISGNTASTSLYPFYVKELREAMPHLLQFNSSTLLYTTQFAWWCTTSTDDNSANDYTYMWQFLRSWITGFVSTGTSSASTSRDINILTWPSTLKSVVIPTSFGGDGKEATFTMVTSTAVSDWTFNGVTVLASPLSVQLTSTNATSPVLTCDFNIAYFGVDVQDPELVTVPTSCDSTDPEPTPDSPDETEDDENPMPSFPPEFSADFQVIMPSSKKIWAMHESYSSYSGSSMTSVVSVRPDNVGRTTKYEWYMDGYSQMSYFYQYKGVVDGKTTLSNTALREYFWPNTESCRRAFIGYGGTSTTSALLLYSSEVVPSFIGNQTVRSIPCRVWSAIVEGARVTWFWARDDVVEFATDSDLWWGQGEYGHLVRMTVEGVGSSAPLFTHHPFFQQGYAMPSKDRMSACYFFGVTELPGCNDLTGSFFFIYDITSFVPYMQSNDTVMPTVCSSGNVRTTTYPNFACDMAAGGAATALVLVVVALICLLLGGCIVWMRFSPIIRTLQEDAVKLAEELRRGEVMRSATVDETNASAVPAPDEPSAADASTDNRTRV